MKINKVRRSLTSKLAALTIIVNGCHGIPSPNKNTSTLPDPHQISSSYGGEGKVNIYLSDKDRIRKYLVSNNDGVILKQDFGRIYNPKNYTVRTDKIPEGEFEVMIQDSKESIVREKFRRDGEKIKPLSQTKNCYNN